MIALAEKRAAYEPIMIRPDDERLAKLTPLRKVPLLVLADGWKVPESTIIIEYLDTHVATGTRLIPEDPDQARQTRFHDRLADLYLAEPLMSLLFKRGDADAAHARLDTMLTGLDDHLAKRAWVMGDGFTMADCALVPPLRYARELHPFDRHPHVSAYFDRALDRPTVAGVFETLAAQLAKSA
jgi:glutathione S-transferase